MFNADQPQPWRCNHFPRLPALRHSPPKAWTQPESPNGAQPCSNKWSLALRDDHLQGGRGYIAQRTKEHVITLSPFTPSLYWPYYLHITSYSMYFRLVSFPLLPAKACIVQRLTPTDTNTSRWYGPLGLCGVGKHANYRSPSGGGGGGALECAFPCTGHAEQRMATPGHTVTSFRRRACEEGLCVRRMGFAGFDVFWCNRATYICGLKVERNREGTQIVYIRYF